MQNQPKDDGILVLDRCKRAMRELQGGSASEPIATSFGTPEIFAHPETIAGIMARLKIEHGSDRLSGGVRFFPHDWMEIGTLFGKNAAGNELIQQINLARFLVR